MKLTDMIKMGMKGFKPSDIRQINESGISTEEVIKLAESGYSVSEVNELISLADKEPEVQPGNEEQNNASGPVQGTAQEPKVQGTAQEPKVQESSEDIVQEKESEIENLKKQLQAAQLQNTQRNLGPADPQSAEDKVKEIFKQLY